MKKKRFDPNKKFAIQVVILLFLTILSTTLIFNYFYKTNPKTLEQFQWGYNFSKKFGNDFSSIINNIIPTDNGYLLMGTYGKNTGNMQGYETVFLMEIDYKGNILWKKNLFNSQEKKNSTLIALQNLYVVSFYGRKSDVISGTVKNYGFVFLIDKKSKKIVDKKNIFFTSLLKMKDGYIATDNHQNILYFNADNKIRWQHKLFASPQSKSLVAKYVDILKTMQTNDGNILVFGQTYDKTTNNLFFLLYSKKGELLRIQFRYNFSFIPQDIIQTDDHGFIIAGCSFKGSFRHITLKKFNQDYVFLWEKKYRDNSYSETKNIVQLNSGNFLISGHSHYKFWLIEIDENGNMIYNKFYHHQICKKKHCVDQSGPLLITPDEGSIFAINGGQTGTWLIKTDQSFKYVPSNFELESIKQKEIY